nr:PfkB family carbohydrate kinase [Sinomonas atrocyanea]
MDAEEILAALQRRRPRILVLGDVLLDRWCEGGAERLCREGPVPVLDVARVVDAPGGAGNTAMNLAALGADVVLAGVAGDDGPGASLTACLDRAGISTRDTLVQRAGHSTSVKSRMLAGGQLLLRVDSCRPAEPDEAREVSDRALAALAGADAVVVCDYGLGALAALDRAAVRSGAHALVVDARRFHEWASLRADVATPNAQEAADLLGEPTPHGDRRAWAEGHARELGSATGAEHTLVTLDRDGTVLLGPPGTVHATAARPAPSRTRWAPGTPSWRDSRTRSRWDCPSRRPRTSGRRPRTSSSAFRGRAPAPGSDWRPRSAGSRRAASALWLRRARLRPPPGQRARRWSSPMACSTGCTAAIPRSSRTPHGWAASSWSG